MLRRNFLRNAVLTVPVALTAPEMLFAENKKTAQKTGVIIIGAGHTGINIAAQLAAANTDVLLLEPGNGIAGDAWHNVQPATQSTASFDKTKTFTSRQVVKIGCTKKGFTLTDSEGNRYTADKLVFTTPLEYSQTNAMVHINTGASKKLPVSIKRNDSTSAQCWAASPAGISQQLLSAFSSSSRPAILCIS